MADWTSEDAMRLSGAAAVSAARNTINAGSYLPLSLDRQNALEAVAKAVEFYRLHGWTSHWAICTGCGIPRL